MSAHRPRPLRSARQSRDPRRAPGTLAAHHRGRSWLGRGATARAQVFEKANGRDGLARVSETHSLLNVSESIPRFQRTAPSSKSLWIDNVNVVLQFANIGTAENSTVIPIVVSAGGEVFTTAPKRRRCLTDTATHGI